MTPPIEQLRSCDLQQIVRRLSDDDRRTLSLLARAPLLWAEAIGHLIGLPDWTDIYPRLQRLRSAGLIADVCPAAAPHGLRLFYLTDGGLAAVALLRDVDPVQLARHHRLLGADLLARLPALPQLLAGYRLLTALASARPGRPALRIWQSPWRWRYHRPTAKTPVRVELPAFTLLAWDGGRPSAYFLIPDRGTFPLRAYRSALDHLLILRGIRNGALPPLIIGTTEGRRAAAWEQLLDETARARHDARLPAYITTWTDLHRGLESLAGVGDIHSVPYADLIKRSELRVSGSRSPRELIPRLVSDNLAGTAESSVPGRSSGRLGRTAMRLGMADCALLDLIGRHPFLSPKDLARALGWTRKWARRKRNRLIEMRLLRLVASPEVPEDVAKRDSWSSRRTASPS